MTFILFLSIILFFKVNRYLADRYESDEIFKHIHLRMGKNVILVQEDRAKRSVENVAKIATR